MPTADDFVEVTTPAKAKRHWSERPTAHWPDLAVLCGTTPCAYDQAQLDDAMPPRWRKRTIIADLPPCASCDRSRQRRIDGRGH